MEGVEATDRGHNPNATFARPISLGESTVEEGKPVFAKGGGGSRGSKKYSDIIDQAKELPPKSADEMFIRVKVEPGTDSDRASNALRTALKRTGGLDSKEWKVRLLADGDLAVVRV